MKIYDISMAIDENTMIYKNLENKKPIIMVENDFIFDNFHESSIKMNFHTGTHIDAPLHMINNGDSIEKYPLDKFISRCRVLDLTNVDECIMKEDLIGKVISNEVVLFKTKNSYDTEFNYEFVYLHESGARYLAEMNVKAVGTDGLGIERSQVEHPTHKILLKNKIPIIEGLRLKEIEENNYIIIALPLKLNGVEASPTRAILVDNFL